MNTALTKSMLTLGDERRGRSRWPRNPEAQTHPPQEEARR